MAKPHRQELFRLHPRVRFRAVENEGVVLHMDSSRILVVNRTGLYVLELLRQGHAQKELAAAVARRFAVDQDQAREDIRIFFRELEKEGVLERCSSRQGP